VNLILLQALNHDRQKRNAYQVTATGTIGKANARDRLLCVGNRSPTILDVLHDVNDDDELKGPSNSLDTPSS
jgi:hypothetical protein